uniref:Transcription initiation factor TFIID subunit 12b-like isoform X2 n=1 Tax=Rhizophora mucronata TaxID=61149 RepID=A0A2P2P229_RHIMU
MKVRQDQTSPAFALTTVAVSKSLAS